MKTIKPFLAFSLLMWTSIGFCLNLSIFEGTYRYTGANYDPTSSPCPSSLTIKQVVTANNEIVNLQLLGTNANGDGKTILIQKVNRNDINPDPSFFKTPKQSTVNFENTLQDYSGSMVINDDGQPFHHKYVAINIKKNMWNANHLNCNYTL